MFFTIYKQELNYWFKRPTFYIYAAIFFALALFFAASTAGVFDFITTTTNSSSTVNSPIGINNLFNSLAVLIFFLFPSIVGVSVYRDYKSEMHSILYSYPFTKANYLFAKFLSSITVVLMIVFAIGLGMFVGFRFPGTNSEIVTSFSFMAYAHAYLVYIIPNVLLFGAIVFGVVTFTRNISAGFITVVLFLLVQGIVESILRDPESRFLSGLLDPFGASASSYYTRYWTVAEQNELFLPFKGVIIYNRLLWMGIAILVFGLVYKYFTFSENAFSFSFGKKAPERSVKSNFGGITRIKLPEVGFDYSAKQNLRTMWKLSNIDFKYIVTSWPFISILLVGLIFIILTASVIGEVFGTNTYPVTWQMLLVPGNSFGLFINILTFLYAGMLVHRGSISRVNHLIDVTPIPNWTLLWSKFIALLKMQAVLLLVIMLGGMSIQIYRGYYNFEIGHYLYELYALNFIGFIIWALLSLFVQTLMKNPYLGLFVLLVISIGIPFLSEAGIEQSIFKYNQAPGFSYSDMNGYGVTYHSYIIHKIYWLFGGLMLLIIAGLFWVRGIPNSFNERMKLASKRFHGGIVIFFGFLLVGFFALGFSIYKENNINNKSFSSKVREQQRVDFEKNYKKYEKYAQPRVVAVKSTMDIYPKQLNFEATAKYTMVNKTQEVIDTLFLNHNGYPSTFTFNKEVSLVLEDSIMHFDMYKLAQSLQPGDSLELFTSVKNKPNTFLRNNSPVVANGTFINNFRIFPALGYNGSNELTDDEARKKYDLPKNPLRPMPLDSAALGNTYISKDSDWIDFEATVSTSQDQIAIAPGYLQKEWVEGDRKYFHYKMDSKILHFYAFNSARYEVIKDQWNDVKLEIYYRKGHEFNLDRMMKGIKASLEYNTANFSPYQHKQLRVIEFPRGGFAQSFPNTIPYAEDAGFIADVDDTDEGGVDYPFAITVHEVAHQWWAHQVIGADVLGSTMLSESLSEYVSLKVLEHQYGKEKMRKFLKKALDGYLTQRTVESKRENALIYNDGQGYIRYQKGSLVFYALSDYIGESALNGALKTYVEKVKFQEPPYTTSEDLVNHIKAVTPDSLRYIIKDMFETITLYKNSVSNVTSTELANGKYQVDIEFIVSKYRNNDQGKRYYGDKFGDTLTYTSKNLIQPILSVPLADYIDIGIFTEEEVDGKKKEVVLYLQKHKITSIHNTISIVVDKKPKEVGVDPYNKLIDTSSEDNRRKL